MRDVAMRSDRTKATRAGRPRKATMRLIGAMLTASLALVLTACGQGTNGTVGEPWVNSNESFNVPIMVPEAKDDLYLHYNYDYITGHQMQYISPLREGSTIFKQAVLDIVKDDAKTDHDLEQLRIFFDQASDFDTLAKTGISEVQPYLDMIEGAQSIEELNGVLTSDAFPFNPHMLFSISTSDKRTVNNVMVNPTLLYADAALDGASYYQESEDEGKREMNEQTIAQRAVFIREDLLLMGVDEVQVDDINNSLLAFEKNYAQKMGYNGKYLGAPYGTDAQAVQTLTLDELAALSPNFPMRQLLAKFGKDASSTYVIQAPEWLTALNEVWTNDNLAVIKTLTKAKVMAECEPFLDPALFQEARKTLQAPDPSGDEYAYTACDSIKTFCHPMARLYAEHVLGSKAVERLSTLSQNLIDDYKELISETSWLSETSKARITEKLDNMTLNVLYPEGGYLDCSGLELTPTSEGGTILGNYLEIQQYRNARENETIGKPALADNAWNTVSPTMSNAFYDPSNNSINIFPGIVTSSIYSDDMSEEELLGGIGFVIGHEISHGFDYSGSQYNAYGMPESVLAEEDVETFVAKRQKLADYYSSIETLEGRRVDGVNVSVEAAADLCGMQVILAQAKKTEGMNYEKFYECQAHDWASVLPPGFSKMLMTDVHPLDYLRININAQMFDEFYDTYGVTEGDGMYLAPEDRIVIWGTAA